MKNLPDAIKRRPISYIKLPGTHDSSAYQLNMSVTPPMEQTPMLDWLKEIIQQQPEIESILEGLTLAQSLSIFEQLEQGIRAFDFRILYSSQASDVFLSHSFATIPLSLALTQIQRFLSQHTGEALIIQMKDDSEHNHKTALHNDVAVSMVRSALGTLLIPVTSNKSLQTTMTLQSLVNSSRRVLFSFTDHLAESYADIWPGNIITDYWPNQQDPHSSIATIETYKPELRVPSNNFLNLVFFTVTPTQDSIVNDALNNALGCGIIRGLLKLGSEMNLLSSNFLSQNQKNFSGINIISADNPSDNYVQQIINWNINP